MPTKAKNSPTLARLRQMLADSDLSVNQIAKRAGVSWRTVHSISQGRGVNVASADAIAAVLADEAATRGGRVRNLSSIRGGGHPAVETLAAGVRDAIRLRAGTISEGEAHGRAFDFAGRPIMAIGREYLSALGLDEAKTLSNDLAVELLLNPAALKSHLGGDGVSLHAGVGDFPSILRDAVNKTLSSVYREAPRTWDLWCSRSTVSDFKDNRLLSLDAARDLEPISRSGEVKATPISDSGVSRRLAEYGHVLPITRRAIINDDLQAFDRLPTLQARAARRLEDQLAYGAINTPSVFNSSNGNLLDGADAGLPGVATMDKVAQRLFDAQDGDAVLGLRPRFALVPVGIAGPTERFFLSKYDPASAETQRLPNIYAGVVEPIITPFLADSMGFAWYVAVDPQQFETVELAFLDGEDEPQIADQIDFDTEALKLKVRHAVAATVLDHRGMIRIESA